MIKGIRRKETMEMAIEMEATIDRIVPVSLAVSRRVQITGWTREVQLYSGFIVRSQLP